MTKNATCPLIFVPMIIGIWILGFYTSIYAQELNFTSEPENLGPKVNSQYSDLAPVISPDGKTLFISRYPPGNDNYNNIWFSVLQPDGSWSEAKDIGSPLNIKGNPTSVKSITPDGNALLLSNIYRYFDGSVTGGGCSMSYRSRGGWTFPKQQNIEKLMNLSEYVDYYLTNESKALLMSIKTSWKTNLGNRDIYVSFKTAENQWSKPKNLGSTINTKGDDASPFLAADGTTLYFSSDGQEGGYGNKDVWLSKRLDDTWTAWSKPVNMGPKINSSDFDSYFTIPASGEYAYFVSSKSSSGKEDIFRIKLPSAAKPDPVVLVFGKVINAKTKEPLEAEIKYEILPDGIEAGTARSGPVNGEYKIVLPFGKNYGYHAELKGFYAINENLDLTNLKEYSEIEKNLFIAPIVLNEAVRLNNIFFEFAKSTLKSESFPELNRVVKFMNENPEMELEISGHTDNVGSDDDNLKLSQDRAQAVVDYIVQNGIKSVRLTAKGYGESVPVTENDSDEGRALNRRVEFKVVRQ